MSQTSSKSKDFKVIIVGASYAGLTLAHCLDRAKISYIVLERRDNATLSTGYGTVIGPNGARILDQLGLYEPLGSVLGPIKYVSEFEDGKLLPKDLPHNENLLTERRFGYFATCADRKDILNILYDKLEDKSRVLFGKHVTEVVHRKDGVTVKCADGSSFEGDIVVAADGIRSKIRDVMREHITKAGREEVLTKDLKSMNSEYKSLYGVADFTDTDDEYLTAGKVVRMRVGRVGIFAFLGKPGKVNFFITWRMQEKYGKDNMPRFDDADIAEVMKPIRDVLMTDKTTFGQLVDRVVSPLLLAPISEMNTEVWTWDRFVCCGDSVVKFMPQIGQGANQAMESAAALTNSLHKMLRYNAGSKPSLDAVRKALREYQDARLERAHAIGNFSGMVTRIMEGATLKDRLLDSSLHRIIDDVSINTTCDMVIGSESLHFLPEPSRVLSADRGFDYNYGGVGKKESKLKRAAYAIPLFVILIAAIQTTPFYPLLTKDAKITWHNISNPFLKYLPTDGKQLALLTPILSDYDSNAKLEAIIYASTLLPLLAVWWIESIRRANTFTFAEYAPLTFGILAIRKGYSVAVPLLCAIHYIQSPLHNLIIQDQRMVRIARIKTLLPSLLFGYVLPTTLAFLPFLPQTIRQLAGDISIMHPFFLSAFSYLFSKLISDTTTHDRVYNPKADLPYLRAIYIFTGTVSALMWSFTLIRAPLVLTSILHGGSETAAEFFYISASILVWVLLSIYDIKNGSRVTATWFVVFMALAGGLVVGGPGAVLVGAWTFREEALARRWARKSQLAANGSTEVKSKK